MRGEAQVDRERGRNLKGDGISWKCRNGYHTQCAAARCKCTVCNHVSPEPTTERKAA